MMGGGDVDGGWLCLVVDCGGGWLWVMMVGVAGVAREMSK